MKHLFLGHVLRMAMLGLGGCALCTVAQAAEGVKPVPVYPHAARSDPKPDLKSSKDQQALQEGLNAANTGEGGKAAGLLQSIIEHSDSRYARALAGQGLANLRYRAGDIKGAIGLLQKSLDSQALPNENYFPLQYELAQLYLADGQDQRSIDTVESWRSIGKHDTADAHALEGQAYYRLGKYPQAIEEIQRANSLTQTPDPSWQQILLASYNATGQTDKALAVARQQLASRPNDPATRENAVAVFSNAQHYSEAITVLEQDRASGQLPAKDYITLTKLHLLEAQHNEDPTSEARQAVSVLKQGFAKAVVPGSADNQQLLGDAAWLAGDNATALQAYEKAAAQARDGDAAVRAGQLLLQNNQHAETKRFLEQGIAKGVKHRGTAYMLLAEADRGLKDRAGAIAAMRQAERDPETAAKARAWLKQAAQ